MTSVETLSELPLDTSSNLAISSLPSISVSFTDSLADSFADELDLDPNLSPEDQRAKLTDIFIRACSNGDVSKVKYLLETKKDSFDINGKDEDGSSGLIFAACFGWTDIVILLIEHSALVDDKDKHGWTPLLWACSNGHDEAARALIDGGASKDIKSNRGRSLKDLVQRTSSGKQMSKILEYEYKEPVTPSSPTASHSTLSMSDGDRASASWSDTSDTENYLLSPNPSRSSYVSRRSSTDSNFTALTVDELGLFEQDEESAEFLWDRCLPDQMFVFGEDHIDHILEIAIERIKPSRTANQRPIAANILFLCARYAHYWNTSDILTDFFKRAITRVIDVVAHTPEDLNIISYWIANCTQIIYYLKKDQGLVATTFQAQATLSELINELANLLIQDLQRRLLALIDDAILEHNGEDSRVRFENIFSSFSRRRSHLRRPKAPMAGSRPIKIRSSSLHSKQPYQVSPWTIKNLFHSTLLIMIHCCVHRSIIQQVFQQVFHFFSAHIFNRILSQKQYCCRSRAIQIRINLTPIEDWVRECPRYFRTDGSCNLLKQLRPVVHLTQLLQVITSIQDLDGFTETMMTLHSLRIPQVSAAMQNYKYEVGEPSFSEAVEIYVQKVVEDIEKAVKTGEEPDIPTFRSELSSTSSSSSASSGSQLAEHEHDNSLDPYMDPDYLLPFSVPAMTNPDDGWPGSLTPYIPNDIFELLDKKDENYSDPDYMNEMADRQCDEA
ncbi:uncharacterized protein BJ171DRAFT_639841 [Polychytrium aggregatum]|uniref:uncharacterized protein n=1 Tax=Polychytrium aggregatum TaxID=110093 RepID=UPI0022FEC0AB|nr:uncharacterized protein BJ171DRAFT_639841 [Polychytrium aggregatum]KAI9207135.1 hypothetical protein BJ171DRAFT_639841 [Polychytrium aggregatum]